MKLSKRNIHKKLIKFQNASGKVIGRAVWLKWKTENGYK